MKKGELVTAKRWYMKRRVYGRILRNLHNKFYAILGNFGLEAFHKANIKLVKEVVR